MDIVKYDWRLSADRPFIYDHQQYPADFSFPGCDMHGDIHLLIMLKGSFITDIGSKRFAFKQGDLILIAPWELHGNYQIAASSELLSLTIFCSSLRSGLSALSSKLDSLLQLPPQERMQHLRPAKTIQAALDHAKLLINSRNSIAVSEAERLAINAFSFNDQECAWEFIRILQLFAGLLQAAGNIEDQLNKRNISELIAPALKLLESGGKIPLTIAAAAEKCNLSSGYFNELFKKTYGISFYTYELKYRLKRAESDLRSKSYSIKEIAQRNGFADASHFSRTFKKYYAKSPSEYIDPLAKQIAVESSIL